MTLATQTITPAAECCTPDAGSTSGHDTDHLEIHRQLINVGVHRFNVEAGVPGGVGVAGTGLRAAGSPADNDTALAALLAYVPSGCELVVPNRYNISAVVDQTARHSLRWTGPGSNDSAYAASAFIMTANQPRVFDWRSARNMLADGVTLTAAAGSGFTGVILDAGDGGNNATMNEIRRLQLMGPTDTFAATLLGLDGSYEFVADHVSFSRFTVAVDGYNLGGRGGGICSFTNRCKFDNPALGAVMFKDPNVATKLDGPILEGDANGKLKIVSAPNQPIHGFGLLGPWIGDVVADQSFIDVPANSSDIFISSAGGIISIPGSGGHATDAKLVKILGNGVRGLVIDGYLSGNGTVVDYGATSGHHGVQHRFVTDHAALEYTGAIPADTVGLVPEFGRRLGARVEGVGTSDPNGAVFGNPGDEWTNRSGAASHVKWVKQTGTNTNTGWVALA